MTRVLPLRAKRTRHPIGAARRGIALLPLFFLLVGAPAAGEQSVLREGSFGFASAVVSLLYGPLKLAYAVSGLALGGSSFLWTWGDRDAAMTIVAMSAGGDYVVTPDHLVGSDDIRFTGDPRP